MSSLRDDVEQKRAVIKEIQVEVVSNYVYTQINTLIQACIILLQ